MRTVRLKSLDKCFQNCEVIESSENYWKVLRPGVIMSKHLKCQIGFRTFYTSYFGTDKTVLVKPHKKYSNIFQMFSAKGMHMMDIFNDWVDEEVNEIKEVPVILDGLLTKWGDLFNENE